MRLVKLAAFALLAQASFLAASAMAAMDGNTMEITLGKVIERNWADVQKGKYAYAAKQDYNVGRKETHIYLPYGRTDGVYFELERAKLVDPAPGSVAKLAPSDMQGATRLGLKFHFDKPISGFRLSVNWSEWNLGDKAVGGFEYSADGKNWTALREVGPSFSKIVEGFIDPSTNGRVKDLKTQDLYIRVYTRLKDGGDYGNNMWVQLWMAGDPAWGDAATTFFSRQWQLWVKEAE